MTVSCGTGVGVRHPLRFDTQWREGPFYTDRHPARSRFCAESVLDGVPVPNKVRNSFSSRERAPSVIGVCERGSGVGFGPRGRGGSWSCAPWHLVFASFEWMWVQFSLVLDDCWSNRPPRHEAENFVFFMVLDWWVLGFLASENLRIRRVCFVRFGLCFVQCQRVGFSATPWIQFVCEPPHIESFELGVC